MHHSLYYCTIANHTAIFNQSIRPNPNATYYRKMIHMVVDAIIVSPEDDTISIWLWSCFDHCRCTDMYRNAQSNSY